MSKNIEDKNIELINQVAEEFTKVIWEKLETIFKTYIKELKERGLSNEIIESLISWKLEQFAIYLAYSLSIKSDNLQNGDEEE